MDIDTLVETSKEFDRVAANIAMLARLSFLCLAVLLGAIISPLAARATPGPHPQPGEGVSGPSRAQRQGSPLLPRGENAMLAERQADGLGRGLVADLLPEVADIPDEHRRKFDRQHQGNILDRMGIPNLFKDYPGLKTMDRRGRIETRATAAQGTLATATDVCNTQQKQRQRLYPDLPGLAPTPKPTPKYILP